MTAARGRPRIKVKTLTEAEVEKLRRDLLRQSEQARMRAFREARRKRAMEELRRGKIA